MKKKMIALLAAALMTLTAATMASAYQFTFDADGTGSAFAPVLMDDIAISGTTNILINYNGPYFTFTDSGTFLSALYHVNGTTGVLGTVITAQFNAVGNGVLGGAIAFTGGSLDLSVGSTPIGSFLLTSGTGTVNPDGTPTNNGLMSLRFDATSLNSDYWGDSNGNPFPFIDLMLGYSTTNAHVLSTVGDIPYTAMTVENGGQFRLEPVPEPGTIALVGLGLAGLGLGAIRRRK